jgi:hypothetical protein
MRADDPAKPRGRHFHQGEHSRSFTLEDTRAKK